MVLSQGPHEHIGVKGDKIEIAIAADKAFLAAHPARRPNKNKGEVQ